MRGLRFRLVLRAMVFLIGALASQSESASPRRATGRLIPAGLQNSTPSAEGLDPVELAAAYAAAGEIPHIYSMLVLKNGYLVSERYFNGQSRARRNPVASVTKSIVSAIVGLAVEDDTLPSLDARMMDFFPEFDVASLDPRKRNIRIRHLLQMRGRCQSRCSVIVAPLFPLSLSAASPTNNETA